MTKLLLENKADPNKKCKTGETALFQLTKSLSALNKTESEFRMLDLLVQHNLSLLGGGSGHE